MFGRLRSIWPCLISNLSFHQTRSSTRFVSYKDIKLLMEAETASL